MSSDEYDALADMERERHILEDRKELRWLAKINVELLGAIKNLLSNCKSYSCLHSTEVIEKAEAIVARAERGHE